MSRRACFCPRCFQTFASERGFNTHRTGDYRNDPPDYGRRCRTPVELEARGFVLKNDGCWHSPPPAAPPEHWRVVRPVSDPEPAELDATGERQR